MKRLLWLQGALAVAALIAGGAGFALLLLVHNEPIAVSEQDRSSTGMLGCPASSKGAGGAFACDGARVAGRRNSSRPAAQVQNFADYTCAFARDAPWHGQAWPPLRPSVANLSSWTDFSQDAFLARFQGWRWPLSTFLRDPWLVLVGTKGELSSEPVEVTMQEYLKIRAATARNVFLFLRDELHGQMQGARARLRRRFFEALQREGFEVRTDPIRIFAMDGLGAGHGMHRHGEAWLVSLAGRKVWWVAPPGAAKTNADGRPEFPYKALSAEEGGWPCSWLLRQDLVPHEVTRCVQQPGEVVLLPAGWWHMTCSLDDFNIAVGGQGV